MKKVLMAVLMVLLFAGYSMATTIVLQATSTYDVGNNGQIEKWVYTSTDSIATGNSTHFKIDTPQVQGNVRELIFSSSSTDCDYYLSESDNQTAADTPLIYVTAANLVSSPELAVPRYFRNTDTILGAFLYFTIDNDDSTNTGNWELNITYGK